MNPETETEDTQPGEDREWRDASPDYAGVVERFTQASAKGGVVLLPPGRDTVAGGRPPSLVRAFVVGLVAGGLVAGAAGWTAGAALADPGVITKPLPLAQACVEMRDAAEIIVATGPQVEEWTQRRDDAHDVWLAETESGSSEAVDEALTVLDDAKRELAAVEDEHDAAVAAFRDANNRCATEVDGRG